MISTSFAQQVLPKLPGAADPPASVCRALDRWQAVCDERLGPASSVRLIADLAAVPLLAILGYSVREREDTPDTCRLTTAGAGGRGPVVVVGPWGQPLARIGRVGVRTAIESDDRWLFAVNGVVLQVSDTRRPWSRDILEMAAADIAADRDTRAVCWTLLRAATLLRQPPLLADAAERSANHGAAVCRGLAAGVLEALGVLLEASDRSRSTTSGGAIDPMFEQAITWLHRTLFLLYAEARALVPLWHPVYRDRYSLGAITDRLLDGRPYPGLASAIEAISQLAHHGCRAGELRVTAFNGRLFSSVSASAGRRLSDTVTARALVAVSSTWRNRRRERIAFRDLDVEQLGAVYEQVLDYQPGRLGESLVRGGDTRKASGSYYTPRPVAAALVRQTLQPLVAGRGADDILRLRVLDPAMGSGAFLVAACRYLAEALEDALVHEGRYDVSERTPDGRAGLRRQIAARCLYGCDLNPTAVQLARLSLWLATLAADKPLSFLDHRLVTGDSLVGASPADVLRQPGGPGAARSSGALPLLPPDDLSPALAAAVRVRLRLALDPDESAAVVREKERTLRALESPDSGIGRWMRRLDLWCAAWFWRGGTPPDRAILQELADRVLYGRCALPDAMAVDWLTGLTTIAQRQRFLHWPLTFPEVFAVDETSGAAGFDAIIGNPPWDMVRGDSGDGERRDDRRLEARQLAGFVRSSEIYVVDGGGHANRYQLFVERALQLTRPGGRVGLILPSGLARDSGSAPLRRHLFDRADVDSITGIDNRGGIFPVHRSLRFMLLTCTTGRPTQSMRCRFGVTRADDLDRPAPALTLSRRLLERISGQEDLGIPELRSELDLAIAERVTAAVPALGAPDGWHVRFGRELNASDDRGAFSRRSADSVNRPVVEGKHVEPFHVALDRCALEVRHDTHAAARVTRRARLAYRDVASATNRLTLIAAIVPGRAVTTHTLFCLKDAIPLDDQHALCALLNSYVANYLMRLRVHTHVTATLMSRLPVPVPPPGSVERTRLTALARTLSAAAGVAEQTDEYIDLQVLAARLYGLDATQFAHILATFPLVPTAIRARAVEHFAADLQTCVPRGVESS